MTGRFRQSLLDVRCHARGVTSLLMLLAATNLAQAQDAAQPAPAEQDSAAAARAAAPEAAKTAPAAPSNPVGEFYGPVKPAETLWSIANRMRPDSKVVTEQVLVALYRANPRAFEGTINKLTKGAVLRVPTRAEITGLSANEARAELRRLWKGGEATEPGRPVIDPLQIAPPPPAGQPVSVAQVEADASDVPSAPPAEKPAEPAAEPPAQTEPAPKPQASQPVLAPRPAVKPAGSALPGWQTLLAPLLLVLFVAVLALSLSRRRRRAQQDAEPSFKVPPPAPEPQAKPAEAAPAPAAAPPPPPPPSPPPAAEAPPPAPAPVPPPVVEPVPAPLRHAESLTMANPPLATDPISTDEIGTKLDLARAYIEMGEPMLARVLLREVLQQGDHQQQSDAEALLARLP